MQSSITYSPPQPMSAATSQSRVQTGHFNGNIISEGISDNFPTTQSPSYNPVLPPNELKRKMGRSAVTHPRKRSSMACEACRKKKSKCDMERPNCGACTHLNMECVFLASKSEQANYDHLEILERVNYVADLLETQCDALSSRFGTAPRVAVESPDTNFASSASQVPSTSRSLPYSEDRFSSDVTQGDADILLESLELAARSPGVSEVVLDWPIFGRKYDREKIETLIFNPQSADYHCTTLAQNIRRSRPNRGVQEDDVLHLINKYLIDVHIKNPILDADNLRRRATWTKENGFSWDASSCLVLIVCALANLSSPFNPEPVTRALVDGEGAKTSISDALDYSTAESYYFSSQKRIAVLENSILATQCYFLSGVYEMYSLRPLKAWKSFNSAFVTLQIYHRSRSQHAPSASKDLERRIYWSCLKSECELRMEINLPPSGHAKMNYSGGFRPPPSGSPEPPNNPTDRVSAPRNSSSARNLTKDSEKVGTYYDSEIAVCKISNRLINHFYKGDETSWLSMPLDHMIRVTNEIELELKQWAESLPRMLAATEIHKAASETVIEEMQLVFYARLVDLRERLYRPFLYLAIHHPATDLFQQTLSPYVQRCIEACLAFLMQGTLRYRHHGTWYENRGMFLKSLLLIAAIKSRHIHIPGLWRQGIDACIAGLQFWELESPDLRESRLILQSLLADLV